MRLTFLPILILAVSLSAEPRELVSISLEGTEIDRLPRMIHILDHEPSVRANEMIEHGGTRNAKWPNSALFKGIIHGFEEPGEWKLQDGRELESGDVIYIFYTESPEDRKALLREYQLENVGRLVERDGLSPELYQTSPNHYVVVMSFQQHFTCSMHSELILEAEGSCPTCGLDLMPSFGYR